MSACEDRWARWQARHAKQLAELETAINAQIEAHKSRARMCASLTTLFAWSAIASALLTLVAAAINNADYEATNGMLFVGSLAAGIISAICGAVFKHKQKEAAINLAWGMSILDSPGRYDAHRALICWHKPKCDLH